MPSSSTTHLYRSLLRELRLSSKKSRLTRNPTVNTHLRALLDESLRNSKSGSEVEKTLLEARDFLKASRIHSDLLIRYNPLHDMSPEERIHATARRVGLDSPVEYKPEDK